MTTNDLSSFIEDVTGESYLRVQENLGDGFVRLRAKEAQRRQAKQDITCFEDVVLELLRNSRDAGATAIFVASWKEQGRRFLTVLDNGDGIPEHLHSTIFEPFVTSKLDTFHEDRWGVHGRGMALYSIKENVDEALIRYSQLGAGTALSAHALNTKLGEKIDQSTLPYIHFSETGERIMRGPRNIARVAMEFALDSAGDVQIFFGSPVEIAATLLHFDEESESTLHPSEGDTVVNYLKYIYDPEAFAERAGELGLPLSSRSARRILNDQIEPLEPFITRLAFENARGELISQDPQESNNTDQDRTAENIYRDQRKLKMSKDDLEAFQNALEDAFATLAEHYYLEQTEAPKFRTSSDKLTITIPFRMLH
ncbi:ATP-binding protein [Anaerotardibacter muris]|uniref:ATP-binding protein n=1 Tax=Anaerotardibacter muris TaxID=2941505 RepID=UPI002040EB24|nr:ATP-binding protein [Anaerotardibacter muris]